MRISTSILLYPFYLLNDSHIQCRGVSTYRYLYEFQVDSKFVQKPFSYRKSISSDTVVIQIVLLGQLTLCETQGSPIQTLCPCEHRQVWHGSSDITSPSWTSRPSSSTMQGGIHFSHGTHSVSELLKYTLFRPQGSVLLRLQPGK